MTDQASEIEAQIPALRRYAYALTRDTETADDLVQDCLERALSRWRLHRTGGDLRAWLFAILRNLFIDRYRAARRRGETAELNESAAALPPMQDAMLGVGDILAALDRLPEEQRSLLLLVGVEDLSYDEAAKVLGVPIGTIMSRLSRARERLRKVLETGRAPHLRRIK